MLLSCSAVKHKLWRSSGDESLETSLWRRVSGDESLETSLWIPPAIQCLSV